MGAYSTHQKREASVLTHSPFVDNSSRVSKNITELGLRYEDSYYCSPKEREVNHTELDRKWFLKFRVGINLFNLFPQKGISYLVQNGFLASCPTIIAYFLLNCVGLSRYKIGEYVGNEDSHFSARVLRQMTLQMCMEDLTIDAALSLYQEHFHLSGNNRKVRQMLSLFTEKYLESNPEFGAHFMAPENVILNIACALLLLNVEVHRGHEVMGFEMFCTLAAHNNTFPINETLLKEMYTRVKSEPFQYGWDYVTEIHSFPIYSKKKRIRLHEYHRRLVYDCIMYRKKISKKKLFFPLRVSEVHVLVFNDLLVVLKDKRNGTHLLVSLINFSEVDIEIKRKSDTYFAVLFRKKSNQAVYLKLVTSMKKKIDHLEYVVKETIAEAEETEKVLINMSVQGCLH